MEQHQLPDSTLVRIVKSIIDNTTIDVLEKNLGLALQATKPAITESELMVLTNEFKQIKDEFLNNSQVEIDENRLLAISCLILNSSEVFQKTGRCEFLTEEFYVLVYSFTLDYLICNPDKGRIFTKLMCQQKQLLNLITLNLVDRITELFSKEQFIYTRAKVVFEKIKQINPEGYTKTHELLILTAFYENLLYVIEQLPLDSSMVQKLASQIEENLSVHSWENFTFESEEFGLISLKSHFKQSGLKLKFALEDTVAVLLKCFARIIKRLPCFKEEYFPKVLKLISSNCELYGTDDFYLVTQVNIMKLVILTLDLTDHKETASIVSNIARLPNFPSIFQENSLSLDSEKRKLSLVFMECLSAANSDKEEKQLWNQCIGLFTTLDSFGKYLIEWETTVRNLFNHLVKNNSADDSSINSFWFLKLLLLKGLRHDNVTIQKYVAEFVFDSDVRLPQFNSVLLSTLIPSLNNHRFYDDIGDIVDIESSIYYKIQEFFGKLCSHSKDELVKILPDIIHGLHQNIDLHHAKPSVWGIFQVIHAQGIRGVKLDNSQNLFTNLAGYFLPSNYPYFRKNNYLNSIISLYGVLELSQSEDALFLEFFSQKLLRESMRFKQASLNIEKLQQTVFGDKSTLLPCREEEILTILKTFGSGVHADSSNRISLFLIDLLIGWLNSGKKFLDQNGGEIKKKIQDSLGQHVESIIQTCRSPYKDLDKLKLHVIPNVSNLVDFIGKNHEDQFVDSLQLLELIFEIFKIHDQLDYDYPEYLEELTDLLIRLITKPQNIQNWKKLVSENTELMSGEFIELSQLLLKNVAVLSESQGSEELKIFNVICLLSAVASALALILHLQLVEQFENRADFVEVIKLVHSTLTKMKKRQNKQLQIYKTYAIEILELNFSKSLGLSTEDLLEKISDLSLITHVRENTFSTVNQIFKDRVIGLLENNQNLMKSFFDSVIKTIKNCRGHSERQHLFQAFLLNSFKCYSDSAIPLVVKAMIECIEIHSSSYTHRWGTLLCIELFGEIDHRLLLVKDLLVLLLTKKENRARDTSFVVLVEDFVKNSCLSKELQEIEIQTNSYGSFPRFTTLFMLENAIKNLLHLKNEESSEKVTQATRILEELIEYCTFSTMPVFMQKIEKKPFRPFSPEHLHSIYCLQMMLVFSEYLKDQTLSKASDVVKKVKFFLLEGFGKLVNYPMQSYTRHYIELLFINSFLNDTEIDPLVLLHMKDKSMKVQPKISVIMITGLRLYYDKVSESTRNELLYQLCINVASNFGYLRTISQYLVLLLDKKQLLVPSDSKSDIEWYSKMALFRDMVSGNEENMILVEMMQDMTNKYTRLLEDMSVFNMFKTIFKGETLEIVHSYSAEHMRKLGNKMAALYEDTSLPENFEEAWTNELKELFNTEKPSNILQAKSQDDALIFQRKIDSLLLFGETEKEVQKKGEMCVVASLLTKLPNLANLTRTSEVLGISELVIPDKNILNDPIYTKVTVTAEKWIPIIECTEQNLPLFLKMKRENGFSIVALEQTSKSTPLSSFKFPDRCVLLLGKEKEGVPYDLLQYVDFCVEIEQFGKIRSLNVHISAVLSIWEFVKQKYIQNTAQEQ